MKKIKIKSIQPIQISLKIKNFIQNINYLINNYVPEINEFPEKKLIRELVKCQEKINKKFGNKIIFNLINKELKNIFKTKEFAVSDFILRYVKKDQKRLKPIILHQEKFYGDKTWENIYNLWIPIRNNNKNNSIKYIKNSHKFVEGKDYIIKEKLTSTKKKSHSHKLGMLYKEKKIIFLKKVKKENLYFKEKIIIFNGNIMHGSGLNRSNLPRISLDLRFMKKKDLKINNKSNSTNKRYFSILSIK
tara:strand:+ start:857 stop:1594 length:738 start_codon:yes stop_codon:yes gene_type:complete